MQGDIKIHNLVNRYGIGSREIYFCEVLDFLNFRAAELRQLLDFQGCGARFEL